MINKATAILILFLCGSRSLEAQVAVSREPRHKNVLENKYLRLLDVWIPPGDTTKFHIHSTPSLFLQFTSTRVGVQIKGGEWVKNKNEKGSASYRSFVNDTLVHRVSNLDTSMFHVTDIELLSAYQPIVSKAVLPFTVLFENEKAVAYRLTDATIHSKIIKGRGPIVAALVEGEEVIYHDAQAKRSIMIKTGKYLCIKPGTAFYFTSNRKEAINLVLFEIK